MDWRYQRLRDCRAAASTPRWRGSKERAGLVAIGSRSTHMWSAVLAAGITSSLLTVPRWPSRHLPLPWSGCHLSPDGEAGYGPIGSARFASLAGVSASDRHHLHSHCDSCSGGGRRICGLASMGRHPAHPARRQTPPAPVPRPVRGRVAGGVLLRSARPLGVLGIECRNGALGGAGQQVTVDVVGHVDVPMSEEVS